MSGGEVLAAALCALGAAVLGALVKRGSKEYALLLSAGAAVLILTAALGGAVPLVESLRELAGGDSLGGRCMEAMLRAVGLTLIGQLAGQLCKDAGEAALAYGVELAVKVAVLTVCLPVLAALMETVGEIINL